MYYINEGDAKWLNALRKIGVKLKPGKPIDFALGDDGVDALETLERFIADFNTFSTEVSLVRYDFSDVRFILSQIVSGEGVPSLALCKIVLKNLPKNNW